MLKNFMINSIIVVCSIFIGLLLFEGAYSFLKGESKILRIVKKRINTPLINPDEIKQKPPTIKDLNDRKSKTDPEEMKSYILDENTLKQLFPEFKSNRVFLGNTPYNELCEAVNNLTNQPSGKNRDNKPSTKFRCAFLRSRIFNNFDPLVYWQFCPDLNEPLSPEMKNFLDIYSFRSTVVLTDNNRNRVTVPSSDSSDIILVIGDSVAFGGGLNNDETISAQLQKRYTAFKFINAGIPGGQPRDSFNKLQILLNLYGNHVKGIIYVHCENDFLLYEPNTPEGIVNGLVRIIDKYDIKYRVFVYQMYIYATMPDIIRSRTQEELKNNMILKDATIKLARNNGFHIVDFYDIVNNYRNSTGSPFAGFALYVDHCHFSSQGVKMVVDQMPPPK